MGTIKKYKIKYPPNWIRLNKSAGRKASPTLFSIWFCEKQESYSPPQRKGVPKGELIGIGSDKYLAALYGLTRFNLKEVAEGADISYGGLRVWRTQDIFKDLVCEFENEYANRLCDYVLKDYVKCGRQEIGLKDVPAQKDLWERIFADVEIYSERLLEKITLLAYSIYKNTDKLSRQRWKKHGIPAPSGADRTNYIVTVLSLLDEKFKKKAWSLIAPGIKNMLFKQLNDFIENPKSKKSISTEDATASLAMIEAIFTRA